MTRKEYVGGAAATTLTGAIPSSGTTLTVQSTSGWPTGVNNFVIVVGRGTSTEEKILVSSVAGTTYSVAPSGRGYDGTSPQAHAVGETVEHCIDAGTIDEANAHVNDTARDDHDQYLNTARHDINARHTFGAAFPTPAAGADIATSGATGSAAGPARSDHTHKVGTGAINDSTMFAAGVVDAAAMGADSVGPSELIATGVSAGSVGAAALIPVLDIDADGRITSATTVAPTPTGAAGGDLTGTYPNPTIGTSKVTSAAILDATIVGGDIAADTLTFTNMASTMVPHTSVTNLAVTGTNNVTSTSYQDWPTSGGGGPCRIVGFVKRKADTKIIIRGGGSGYVVTLTASKYQLAVDYGSGQQAIEEWFVNTPVTTVATTPQVTFPDHQYHGGTCDLGTLAAGTYTFKLVLKRVSGAAGAWQSDTNDRWFIEALETY